MKICPTCGQNYTDDTLNFCLTDGAALTHTDSGNMVQPTVSIPATRQTDQNPSFGNQSFGNQTGQPNWGMQPNYPRPLPPPRRSRAGLLISVIIGAILLVSIIGGAAIALITIANRPKNPPPISKPDPNRNYANVIKDDFSTWRTGSSDFGTTAYKDNEFIMSSKQAGFYYVLITAKKEFKTTNASTKVTVRNINGTASNSGYGLVIDSDPATALVKDYVFLIDSANQSYRVSRHEAKKEIPILKWTKSSAIHGGTQPNDIEVRDDNGKMTLYINDQMISDFTNASSYFDGVAGIYAGDGIPIAFSNLKLGK